MQNGGLSDSQVKSVFSQICDAISFSHSKGYFHRDIKPENILVVDADAEPLKVKLTDFGLATRDTWSHEMGCGSVRYISPGNFFRP